MIHAVYFLALGCFWGLSVPLYKLMGEAGLPVSAIVTLCGLLVGLPLWAIGQRSSGHWRIGRPTLVYSSLCALLMTGPFALSVFIANTLPAAEYALIASTAPFFNYLLALATRREGASRRRLAAVLVGFLSSATLILTRQGASTAAPSLWTAVAFAVPLLYLAYNWYAARGFPAGENIYKVGAVESLVSGLLGLPFLLLFAPPLAAASAWPLLGFGFLLAACLMWILERVAFFTLIRDKGALYTIQATYIATPAAVLFAVLLFGGGSDIWLWVSLAMLMLALWLNIGEAPAKPGPEALKVT